MKHRVTENTEQEASGAAWCFASLLLVVVSTASIALGQGQGQTQAPAADGADQPQWFEPRKAERAAAGTVVIDGEQQPSERQPSEQLLMLVRGSLTAGDVDVVSETVRYYGDLFNLVYLATKSGSEGKYKLDNVAVGYAAEVSGRWLVVESKSARSHGLRLNLIGSSVLSANEKTLDDIQVVAQTDTRLVLDSPVFFRHQGSNRPAMLRFFIWITPADGSIGTAVWLLERIDDGYRLFEPQLNYLAPRHIERAVLHVDGDEFSFGIPSPQAFAVTTLPRGRTFPMTSGLAEIAADQRFSHASFDRLAIEMAATFGQQ